MKRSILVTMVLSLMLSGSFLLAQPMPGARGMHHPGMMRGDGPPGAMMFKNIPNLTEEQKEQIKALRLDMMKKALPIRNTIGEKRARLRTLQTQASVNMKEVNALIDEIAGLKARIAKMRAAKRQQIRNLLTDEQRIVFDSRPMHPRGGKKSCGPGGKGPHRPGM